MHQLRHFILTDHKPLSFALQHKRERCSLRQFKHLDFISQFTTDIRHISGQENIVADALCRVEAITAPVTHYALAAAQDDDDVLRTLLVSDSPTARETHSRHFSRAVLIHLLENHAHTSHFSVRFSTSYIPSVNPE